MTASEKAALRRDLNSPLHLFTIVVENNTEGVSNQMQTWGLTQTDSTAQQMVSELVRAYNAGGQVKAQALGLIRNVKYKYGVLPAGFDEAITGRPAPPQMRTTDGQGSDQSWYSEMDWGGIIDSIFGGINTTIGNTGNGGSTTPPPAGDQDKPTTGINAQWLAVGAAVLVVIVAIVIAMRE